MKRPLIIAATAVLTIILIYACGSTIRTATTSLVTITIGDAPHTARLTSENATPWTRFKHFLASAKLMAEASASIPSVVQVITVTVSAPDMKTMVAVMPVAGLPDAVITIEVPNGNGRNFLVEGIDASSTVVYNGQTSADLTGAPLTLTIGMNAVFDSIPPTFGGLTLVSNLTSTSVQLFWYPATDNVTPATGIVYLIYQATAPGGETYTEATYTTAPGATSYIVNGLAPGTTYYFVVRAMDAAGNMDSNTIEGFNVYPGLYVDSLNGNDNTGTGSTLNPYKTISQALTVSAGNEAIFTAASGTYDAASGEIFPLQLKPGTILIGLGPSRTTVIDASSGGDAIYGNTGAVIYNYTILPGSDATAINDQATPIAVSNVLIGVGAFAWEAVILSADSTLSDSAFSDTYSTYITVNGGNPAIINNTFPGTSNSPDGILVNAGNPVIMNNTFTGSSGAGTAISIQTGLALVDTNAISWGTGPGSVGIRITGGTPVITGNTITGNDTGIVAIGGPFNPVISTNTINNNASYGIDINGSAGATASINNNSIFCNGIADLNAMVMDPLDATVNAWDHDDKTVPAGPALGCLGGYDLCSTGTGTVNYVPFNAAVPNGCLTLPVF